jgi:hypothetical protein
MINPEKLKIEINYVNAITGINRNEKAANAIDVCLIHDVRKSKDILDSLEACGFNRTHAQIALATNTGTSANNSRWHRTDAGEYHSWAK